MTTVVLNTPGSGTWVVPANAPPGTSIAVTAVGGGTAGATTSTTYIVTPHDATNGIAYTVGAGASQGSTSFSTNNLNVIRNTTNVGYSTGTFVIGASIGATTSSASLASTSGLTFSIPDFGTDQSTGLPYVDWSIVGTPTASGWITWVQDVAAPASVATYDISCYLAIVAGSLTNITTPSLKWNTQNSGAYVSTPSTLVVSLTSTLTRFDTSAAAPATTNQVAPYLEITVTNGSPVNATFRMAGWQTELGSSPSFYKSTPGYALAAGGGSAGANGSITLVYSGGPLLWTMPTAIQIWDH